jgi:hypothetical protein
VHVRFGPKAGHRAASFHHLDCTRLHCRGHFEAERLGCLQIDVELDFSGLLDWQVGRFFAIKNPANVIAREAVCLPKVRSSPRSQAGGFRFG